MTVLMSRHKSWIMLDNHRRKMCVKFVLKKLMLKATKKSKFISNSRRYMAYFHLVRLPRLSSKTFIQNRCIKSGRVWSNNGQTYLSRFELRNETYKSNLPGMRRGSW